MYSAEINRNQPACLLLLVDQSFSMSEPWADTGTSKADQLAMAVNRILGNSVLLCSKGDDRIFDYFEVGVLGYGADVGPVLHGADYDRPVLPISEVALNPRRIDQKMRKIPDGAGGVVETQTNVPVWVDPSYNGKTPMVQALQSAEEVVTTWCAKHPESFPPIVINITDGMSTDGDPSGSAAALRRAVTDDGHALLFNLHISSLSAQRAVLPSDLSAVPDEHATRLFEMSSALPTAMLEAASSVGYDVQPGSRGFLYNAEAHMVIEFLDIGTRAVTPTGLKELTAGQEPDS